MEASQRDWDGLFTGEHAWLGFDQHGQPTGHSESLALLPGAFNPVHAGHWALAATAERLLRRPVGFELSILNVDKPPLSRDEAMRRLRQFQGRAAVYVTRAATFLEKARLFSGRVFVVGADTAARLVAPRYYGDEPAAMVRSLTTMAQLGCRFLVAGRVDRTGRLVGLDDLSIPPDFRTLFTGIPQSEFRLDISSTELRDNQKPGFLKKPGF